jgi:apolipoprotein N-acyltransferase
MSVLLAFLSGILLSGAFAPFALWWLAPSALLLLLFAFDGNGFKVRALVVIVFSASFFLPLLHWTSVYVGALPWLLLVLLQVGLLFPLALLPTTDPKFFILFPSAWVCIEILRTHFPFGGFGWGRVGFSQANAPYSSFASIAGVSGLSFLVALVSVSLFLVIKKEFTLGLVTLFVVGILFSTTLLRTPVDSEEVVTVLAVQGGVPKLGLDFNDRAHAVFSMHEKSTRSYLESHSQKPSFIVWPENSVDVDPFKDNFVRDSLNKLADDFQVPIIIGAVLTKGNGYENASIAWLPGSGPSSIYVKKHLTPFGEYVPLRSLAEFVSPFAKGIIDFIPGTDLQTHVIGGAKISPVICYELLDDQLNRAMAARGNTLLIQTNSATFGLTPESAQELEISRIRAIEHQRFAISIATSGISAAIDDQGRVLKATAINKPEAFLVNLPLQSPRSVSDSLGNSAEILIIFLPLFLFLVIPFLYRVLLKRFSVVRKRSNQ